MKPPKNISRLTKSRIEIPAMNQPCLAKLHSYAADRELWPVVEVQITPCALSYNFIIVPDAAPNSLDIAIVCGRTAEVVGQAYVSMAGVESGACDPELQSLVNDVERLIAKAFERKASMDDEPGDYGPRLFWGQSAQCETREARG